MDVAVDSLGNATGLATNNRWLITSPYEKNLLSRSDDLIRSTEYGDKIVTG
ncbi:MAG: hypothetical protein PF569_00905 [Candidatus Woesearchaeota archaeon]|jgi:hypothetical protein|nr:hypothetical protein [Candidatus Woesearchaeota archaeon]